MCGFKPGDEVESVWDGRHRKEPLLEYLKARWAFRRGRVFTVTRVFLAPGLADAWCLSLAGLSEPSKGRFWAARWFRKVQRRDLAVWLATENTIDNPNPIRRPKRADA